MKQILQNMANGKTSVVYSPSPQLKKGCLIIRSSVSLISSGTEKMLVDFGKSNILDKARKQPEKVKQVINKIQTDGLISSINAVKSKLEQPLPLGYCNVGIIESIGSDVEGFKVGDRVISNGPHADVVCVPKNLCAKIPDNVSNEEASFTVLASIGLQGVRLAKPTLGELFVVIGVGLIGLLTIQILRANGCKVLAIDIDEERLELAKKFGATAFNSGSGNDPILYANLLSKNNGVDGVIITASTSSNDLISQAAKMCRKKGRIVLVGVTGLSLNRTDFYEKEISFQVSCSYGPGRYDPKYEENGYDYPFGFVRWTEQRNFEAILDLISRGQLNVMPLITHRFKFENAENAYEMLSSGKPALGILLQYNQEDITKFSQEIILNNDITYNPKKPSIGFIGAGNYASRMLIPAFDKFKPNFKMISSTTGISGVIHGKKFNFERATSDTNKVFDNPDINTVVIATRHNTHAKLVNEALSRGKNVFVEKPLAITIEELNSIKETYNLALIKNSEIRLMVGFNRRFSPLVTKMKNLLKNVHSPKAFVMTINAGSLPCDHWTKNIEIGGGRIIGEACHFIDLMRFLVGKKILSYQTTALKDVISNKLCEDISSITLSFEDGSFGTINYLANGASNFPKERIEVFCDGKVLQLDNFIKLKGFGWPNFSKMSLWKQNKGQTECVKKFLEAIELGNCSPVPVDELFEVAEVTIKAAHNIRD
ncbi:bi-domain-containing oxidoreductase [Zooshikella marina]|uniref:bi-domain-containing oxidoreductase n=1 Tax=Zooshikella ganghwensis TaxID=202772 RepID=UPI001BB0AD27|nr:bi-domain-containing oxidoreductase [Zooshikella ganghwensis]MBU2704608.1 bi-domain-containing oxidoreductase [Zooshikella ganghwensis]